MKQNKSWRDWYWHQKVWIITCALLILLIAAWGKWASSYGTTIVGRTTEINDLIDTTHTWENAKDKLNRLQEIIIANPASVPDAENALIQAESEVNLAKEKFEEAGFIALNGELIILCGVILQVTVALILTKTLMTVLETREKGSRARVAVKLKEQWVEKIHIGQALEEEDEILKQVDDEIANLSLSLADVLHGQRVTTTYKRLMAKCRKATREEIPWLKISNLFYKLTLICRERSKSKEGKWGEWQESIKNQYNELRQVIRYDTGKAAYHSIFIPVLFLVTFVILSFIWNSLSGDTLEDQLFFWRGPVLMLGMAFVASGIVHVWGNSFAHWIAEKTWTDLDDVIISAIIGPLSALATAIFLVKALDTLTGPADPPLEFGPFLTWVTHEATASLSRTFVLILVGTWFAVFVLNHVLVWAMEQWAKRTTQIYDDMFVKMVQVFGTFILLAIGVGAALATFNGPLSKATGVDNIILPYTIIVSVFTAIAGFAASAGFENFFGGLLLQIEKPFDRGERIILPDGQICDVRDIGMRSTVLYNVTEHSEVSVPNSEMAKMIIKNTSRPDLELRIAVPAWIVPGTRNLKIAGAILLDIAYLEREIDQMRVFGAELNSDERDKMKENLFLNSNRITIADGMQRLINRHVKIRKTIVSKIIGGGIAEPESVFNMAGDTNKDPWRMVLKSIEDARQSYRGVLEQEDGQLLVCVKELEGDRADEMLRSYRRAVYEIIFSDSPTYQDGQLNTIISNAALHERINKEKLHGVLLRLSRSQSKRKNIDNALLDKVRENLKVFESKRLGIVLDISDNVAILENYIYAIGEQFPDVRPELDGISAELAKEPSLSSEYSEDGHVRLVLSCYALYLERRLQVQHKINRDIEWRFHSAGIKFERLK